MLRCLPPFETVHNKVQRTNLALFIEFTHHRHLICNVSDSSNDMNTNAYKAAIHKVHERTIYEPSNALPFYIRECGGGWACLESRHKDWRFYYLTINTRLSEPDVVMQWSLNPQVCQDICKIL